MDMDTSENQTVQEHKCWKGEKSPMKLPLQSRYLAKSLVKRLKSQGVLPKQKKSPNPTVVPMVPENESKEMVVSTQTMQKKEILRYKTILPNKTQHQHVHQQQLTDTQPKRIAVPLETR